MPRQARLDYPGARHHVFNRFAGRASLFDAQGGRQQFLDVLGELPERYGVIIHGYALMSNHYHLMVEVPGGNLSRSLQHLGATFTRRFHRHHGGDGPLFRSRFRNEVVDTDVYWMRLLIYLHLNPVRAGVVASASDTDWTSHRAYVGLASTPTWLTTEELLAHFGSAHALDEQLTAALPSGGALPEPIPAAPPSTAVRPKQPPRAAATALAQVAALLTHRPLPHGGPLPNTGRRLSAWWLWRATNLTMTEIGDLLGVSRSRVRQLVVAFQAQVKTDPVAAELMRKLLFPGLRRAS